MTKLIYTSFILFSCTFSKVKLDENHEVLNALLNDYKHEKPYYLLKEASALKTKRLLKSYSSYYNLSKEKGVLRPVPTIRNVTKWSLTPEDIEYMLEQSDNDKSSFFWNNEMIIDNRVSIVEKPRKFTLKEKQQGDTYKYTYVSIGKPILNRDKTKALVQIISYTGDILNIGSYFVLEKQNGKWVKTLEVENIFS